MLRINNLRSVNFEEFISNTAEKKKDNLFNFDIKDNPARQTDGYIENIFVDENIMQEFRGDDFFKKHDPFRFREDDFFYDKRQKETYIETPSPSADLDGDIDASTQSDTTGDCWLLTGLNSLSYSEGGAQAIKDAMTFNNDGSVTITFKGVGTSYTISAQDLARANNDSNYSSGDDDVLAFELAAEKLRNDIASGKIRFSSDSPYYVSDTTSGKTGTKSIDGGYTEQVYYLLTGKLSETSSDSGQIEKYLDAFQNNPDSTAMSCSIKGGDNDNSFITVKDASGRNVKLYNAHAYAVKSVDDDTVTLVNPWDSTQDIVLSRDAFSKIANVSYCDLSDKSKDYSGVFQKAVDFVKDKIRKFLNNDKTNDKDLSGFNIFEMMINDLSPYSIFKFKKSLETN